MNIVNKLTIRHLQQNKRRTLVTIMGVIISVAMVTAVATLGGSFLELIQENSLISHSLPVTFFDDVFSTVLLCPLGNLLGQHNLHDERL